MPRTWAFLLLLWLPGCIGSGATGDFAGQINESSLQAALLSSEINLDFPKGNSSAVLLLQATDVESPEITVTLPQGFEPLAYITMSAYRIGGSDLQWQISQMRFSSAGASYGFNLEPADYVIVLAVHLPESGTLRTLAAGSSTVQPTLTVLGTGAAMVSAFHAEADPQASTTHELGVTVEQHGIGHPTPHWAGELQVGTLHELATPSLTTSWMFVVPEIGVGAAAWRLSAYDTSVAGHDLFASPAVVHKKLNILQGDGTVELSIRLQGISALPQVYVDHTTVEWAEELGYTVLPFTEPPLIPIAMSGKGCVRASAELSCR